MDFLDQYIPLNLLPIGETGIVQKLLSTGTQRRRMLDLGLVNGTPVESPPKKAPQAIQQPILSAAP